MATPEQKGVGVSLLAQLQPKGEGNRWAKRCAQCEAPIPGAAKMCTRCRCTPYCSRVCQAAHWKAVHKGACGLDPLGAALELQGGPLWRPFSPEERDEEALFWTLRAGSLAAPPCDNRDGHCSLINRSPEAFQVLQDHAGDADEASSNGGVLSFPGRALKLTRVSKEAAAAVGWRSPAQCGFVSGYGTEDVEYFRFFCEDPSLQWGEEDREGGSASLENTSGFEESIVRPLRPLPGNLVAHAVAGDLLEHRGNFVVAKVRLEAVDDSAEPAPPKGDHGEDGAPGEKGEAVEVALWREVLVPFPKTELVDLCCWRRFCGAEPPKGLGGLHSTRIHRENMRRKEMADFLKKQGFAEGKFTNTFFHGGI